MHRGLRIQKYLVAIDRRLKRDTRLLNLANVTQAKHLKTTGVGQDGTLPAHEIMQVTMQTNDVSARTQPEVKCITQQNVRTRGAHILGRHTFYRAVGTHWHKSGRLNGASIKRNGAASRQTISGSN